jgi:hypothetical protein
MYVNQTTMPRQLEWPFVTWLAMTNMAEAM